MAAEFDRDYWESHWQESRGSAAGTEVSANPYLAREVADLAVGTALDAGCGEGAEALWLASAGWRVTAVDISAAALARAAERSRATPAGGSAQWVRADLTTWEPDHPFDLVTTHYAHPAMPQLAFYERVAQWVAPGGTLLVVGHRHGSHDPAHGHGGASHGHGHGHGHGRGSPDSLPPPEATVTAAAVVALLDPAGWDVVTATEEVRVAADREGRPVELYDVVVRATRRG